MVSFYKENATPNRACPQVIKLKQVAEQCRGFVKYKLHENPHILRDDEVRGRMMIRSEKNVVCLNSAAVMIVS